MFYANAVVSLHGQRFTYQAILCGSAVANIAKDGHVLSFYEREVNIK